MWQKTTKQGEIFYVSFFHRNFVPFFSSLFDTIDDMIGNANPRWISQPKKSVDRIRKLVFNRIVFIVPLIRGRFLRCLRISDEDCNHHHGYLFIPQKMLQNANGMHLPQHPYFFLFRDP